MGSSFTKLGMDKIKNGTLKRWNCDATNFSRLYRSAIFFSPVRAADHSSVDDFAGNSHAKNIPRCKYAVAPVEGRWRLLPHMLLANYEYDRLGYILVPLRVKIKLGPRPLNKILVPFRGYFQKIRRAPSSPPPPPPGLSGIGVPL